MNEETNRLADRSLRWLTTDLQEQRNVVWLVFGGLLTGMGMALCGGTIELKYLEGVGFDGSHLGRLTFVAGAARTAGLFLFMGLADRFSRRVPVVGGLGLVALSGPLALLALSLMGDRSTVAAVLVTLMVVRGIEQPIASLRAMVRTGLYVRAVRVGIRGRLASMRGIVGGGAGMLMGVLSGWVLGRFGYPKGYTVCFATGTVLVALGALTIWKLAELPELNSGGRSRSIFPLSAMLHVYGLRRFRILIVPNILRGLVSAVGIFMVKIGSEQAGLLDKHAGYMVSLGMATGMVATVVLGYSVDRWGPGKVIMSGNVLAAVGLVWMSFIGLPGLFLALWTVYGFGRTLMDSAVPLGTFEIAPPEVAGAFNGARLMIMDGVGAVSGLIVGQVLGPLGAFVVLGCAAIGHLATGVLYWYGFQRRQQHH